MPSDDDRAESGRTPKYMPIPRRAPVREPVSESYSNASARSDEDWNAPEESRLTPRYMPAPRHPPVRERIRERYSEAPPAPRSDLIGALLSGLGGVVIVAVLWFVAGGVLGLSWGLFGVAAIGGWIVGNMVSSGAWDRGGPRSTDVLGRLMAVGLALLAWLAGTYLAYLWKLSVSAQASEPLLRRLAEQDFQRWLPSQFGPAEGLQLAIIAFVALWSSR